MLSVSAGDREGLLSPETLEAVAGYSLLRTGQMTRNHLTNPAETWYDRQHG
ncbi:MAG: hypothetical protein L0332_23005 [Chloroflexi bacterium]|nr:hypothetical protein [Chloroflexota bacterium]MCI0578222.1 hypothetical protein [Chloroflexota bacterium]MCI0645285.1 hypothetical protein [Chloroflexota bacterium]MCI0729561.1 hypothetical protein [Chloroflexota bacterium]